MFFFNYHLNIDRFKWMKIPIMERKYMIDRFIEQKQKEKEDMEKEMKNG